MNATKKFIDFCIDTQRWLNKPEEVILVVVQIIRILLIIIWLEEWIYYVSEFEK
jgi:hypothetical protein